VPCHPEQFFVVETGSAKTSAIQIFQHKPLKCIGYIIAHFEKKSVNFFTCLVLVEGRCEWLKPGHHLIHPSKKSWKIFV